MRVTSASCRCGRVDRMAGVASYGSLPTQAGGGSRLGSGQGEALPRGRAPCRERSRAAGWRRRRRDP
eukprot:2867359-Prymnesium_polylepis.1